MFHVERGAVRERREGRPVRIGLSYDQGTADYALYASALEAAGERYGIRVEPVWLAGVVFPLNRAAVESVDGVVMTGGADVEPWRYGFEDREGLCRLTIEERDEAELPILEAIFRRRIPVLAICRGMQLLNIYRGGTLEPDIPNHDVADDDYRHPIRLAPDSRLACYAQTTRGFASSSHHQAVKALGSGLRATAWADDGTIEAIEWLHPADEPWLAAVQWHPETMRLDEPLAGAIFQAFLDAVDRRFTNA